MNKLKTKILSALSFLYCIILMLGLFGSGFISRLSKDSGAIIKDNFASLGYAANMSKALNGLYILHAEHSLPKHSLSLNTEQEYSELNDLFNKNFRLEENNITETGEAELVSELKDKYRDFLEIISKAKSDYSPVYSAQLREKYQEANSSITSIYKINSNAILYKNSRALQTSEKVTSYMIVISMLSLLAALIFIVYFPGYFLGPIKELTGRIKAVSDGDYNQKLLYSSNNELGQLADAFNLMSGRLKEYQENNLHKLIIEKKRIEAVINSLNDAIVVLDENNSIVSANRVALELTGMQQENVIGKYAPDIAVQNDLLREMLKDSIPRPQYSGTDKNTFIPVITGQKKSYFTKEVIETTLDDNNTSSGGCIIILKNVTLFEERDSAKTNLIATVSHELKTPLSSINLSIKLLEDKRLGELSDEHKKIVGTVRQETQRLSKMVNELLDYSQTESGNIRLKIGFVRPEDIIDYAITSLMILISDKNIQVETFIASDLPDIKADIEKTVWVLVNLITNAVRYTHENGIIKICCQKNGNNVQFSVIDQGPGIEKENLSRIFDKFIQIGNNPKGRGLGLAIAKEFVTSQSGEIWAESELGVGSTFAFILPAA